MPYRKTPLVQREIYHIFTKSIAGFKIFNSDKDFKRIAEAIVFYITNEPQCKFSLFLEHREKFKEYLYQTTCSKRIVNILAYCFMPTHIHLVLQQLNEDGISKFINLVLKSYSKYFNIKYDRKGPLWEGRFKNVLVETDEQLLHLTRYIHLNPVTSFLVNNPGDWMYSSYREFIGLVEINKRICNFSDYLHIDSFSYQKFVADQIAYQRDLERIKHLIIE